MHSVCINMHYLRASIGVKVRAFGGRGSRAVPLSLHQDGRRTVHASCTAAPSLHRPCSQVRVPLKPGLQLYSAYVQAGGASVGAVQRIRTVLGAKLLYSGRMVKNRQHLAEEFTTLVLDAIRAEENMPVKPRNPVLVTLSVRLPVKFKNRLKKAAKMKGVEMTQMVEESLRPILAVILQDEEPGSLQRTFDQ